MGGGRGGEVLRLSLSVARRVGERGAVGVVVALKRRLEVGRRGEEEEGRGDEEEEKRWSTQVVRKSWRCCMRASRQTGLRRLGGRRWRREGGTAVVLVRGGRSCSELWRELGLMAGKEERRRKEGEAYLLG